MAEINTFLSEGDLENIAEFLFQHGCWMVPDEILETKTLREVRTLDEFKVIRANRKGRLFFVLNSDWQKESLEIAPIEKDGRDAFHIHQRVGGPTLDILAHYEMDTPHGRILPAGFVSYHSTFWSVSLKQDVKPDFSLVNTYKEVKKLLRRSADTIAVGSRKYLVAAGAKERLKTGIVLGPPFSPGAGKGDGNSVSHHQSP